MENEKRKAPVKVLRCGSVEIAIWLHKTERDGRMIDVPTAKISRSFKNKETGQWENTDFLQSEDLPKVALLATEAYKFLKLKSSESNTQSSFTD